ncbi:Gti1/Pac2 family-domain-containing protein [Chytriomyces cf. hyalinus JEL632]|nr:Gti1/Pac2 family-domain-containing protein [Chytriomyces cf. hyalinus JEL632]
MCTSIGGQRQLETPPEKKISRKPTQMLNPTPARRASIPRRNNAHPDPFTETFYGFIKDTLDASLLIESCIAGTHTPVKDIPFGVNTLPLRSGSVVVFAESSAQSLRMRWRDGWAWSSSRIHGAFLLYREVEPTTSRTIHQQIETTQLFTQAAAKPNTKLIPNGMAKRTITLHGSDGNRYRVISYFYPNDVEYLYKPVSPQHTHYFPVPSRIPAFQRYQQKVRMQQAPSPPRIHLDESLQQQHHNNQKHCSSAVKPSTISLEQTFLLQRFAQECGRYGGSGMKETMQYFKNNPQWVDSPVTLPPLRLYTPS